MTDFIKFLLNPKYHERIDNKLKFIIYSLFFIVIPLSLFVFVKITQHFFDIELSLIEKFPNTIWNKEFIIKMLIFAPIFEELLFRAILKPGKLNLFLFVTSFSYYILHKLEIDILLSIIISIVFGLFFLGVKKKSNTSLYNKYYLLLVYVSSIVFGLIHVFNYHLTMKILLLSPLLMLPRIFGGFSLAFIRVKFGLVYSIMFHFIYNSTPFIVLYFTNVLH